ncbi:hypothetical protein IT408_04595 [Candidatus Uhrbacteria bacterium]|nr:hypothetical protein [Candidatus Uhrbacteria bacterium]
MILPPLVTPAYWFSTTPIPFTPLVDRILIILSIALAMVGVAGIIYVIRASIEKRERRVYQAASWQLVWIGLVGLLLWTFTYERVPVLSIRIAWVFWIVWIAWMIWKTWHRLTIEIPEESERFAERDRLKRWLPKKKS